MTDPVHRTPLHDLHVELGARMVGFAGYSMPVQYAAGVMKEHLHTREAAGLFDVSHMGQVKLCARSGALVDAARAMERLVPADLVGLAPGRQRYGLFTDEIGGILDDLMVAARDDHLFVVVNAACKADDLAHMRALLDDCQVDELADRALLALQGPKAAAVLEGLAPDAAAMKFMDVRDLRIDGVDCTVSRSGYTGEDGFEISMPAEAADPLARRLLEHEAVAPIGLGARDSLRLEAGLCLYGHDIDTRTTPVEAALEWAIPKVRRRGGTREGHFPGAEMVLAELEDGAPRRRVGIRPEGRAPMREGTPLFAGQDDAEPVGRITSGGFGPTVGGPVSMGYVPTAMAAPGTELFADVRGKRLPATVAALPFIRPGYKRN